MVRNKHSTWGIIFEDLETGEMISDVILDDRLFEEMRFDSGTGTNLTEVAVFKALDMLFDIIKGLLSLSPLQPLQHSLSLSLVLHRLLQYLYSMFHLLRSMSAIRPHIAHLHYNRA